MSLHVITCHACDGHGEVEAETLTHYCRPTDACGCAGDYTLGDCGTCAGVGELEWCADCETREPAGLGCASMETVSGRSAGSVRSMEAGTVARVGIGR